MKRVGEIIGSFVVAFLILLGAASLPNVSAQNPTLTPYQFAVSAPHTNCVVIASQTNYCFASDGPYVSIAGAAYVSMLSASAGVTSFNGRTGAVTLSDADVIGTGLKVVTTVTAVSTPQ
jgi:hypothetical protein